MISNICRSTPSFAARKLIRRSFFASSTDHTTLLANATIHRIGDDAYGERTYILLPKGTDLDLALKVDKLHLARISANKNYVYHAKVVQRSLGPIDMVCKPILEEALKDARSEKPQPVALASLEGLSKWVAKGFDGQNKIPALEELRTTDEKVFEAVKAIATGIPRPGHSVVGQGTYRDAEEGWKMIAQEFVSSGLSEESELYKANGGALDCIEHLADTSREGLMDSGGSMARFTFD